MEMEQKQFANYCKNEKNVIVACRLLHFILSFK